VNSVDIIDTRHGNHIPSGLMRESLVDKEVIARSEAPVGRILPHLNVIQIGGKLMDRGRSALMPLLDEIAANQEEHVQVIAVGAGVRSRHLFAVGLDLGLPTGVLATLSAKDSAQNAYMISCLLAHRGFVYLEAPFIVQLLPAMLAAARGAVFNGVPPYDLWEHPPEIGRIPQHRADTGAYMTAEVFGARRMIFVKDVDGLYTCDPAVDRDKAEFIPRISVSELIGRKLSTLPLDPLVLSLLASARLVKEVKIVNGLVPGALTKALGDQPVGTAIHSD
jgi:molybdenum storage protein